MSQNIFKSLGFPLEQAAVADENSRDPGAGGGAAEEFTIEDLTLSSAGSQVTNDFTMSLILVSTTGGVSAWPDGETQGQLRKFKVTSVGGGSPSHTITGKMSANIGGDLGDEFSVASGHQSTWRWDVGSDRWILTDGTANINYPS